MSGESLIHFSLISWKGALLWDATYFQNNKIYYWVGCRSGERTCLSGRMLEAGSCADRACQC